jgi:hypothetical protein
MLSMNRPGSAGILAGGLSGNYLAGRVAGAPRIKAPMRVRIQVGDLQGRRPDFFRISG